MVESPPLGPTLCVGYGSVVWAHGAPICDKVWSGFDKRAGGADPVKADLAAFLCSDWVPGHFRFSLNLVLDGNRNKSGGIGCYIDWVLGDGRTHSWFGRKKKHCWILAILFCLRRARSILGHVQGRP